MPAESDKTPRVPPCRPCAGHDAPGLLSDLTQNVKKRIKARENEDSDRRKRGFLRLRKKAGIKRAVSHRIIHSDRQQPTAISGENKRFRELWAGWQGCLRFPDSHSQSVRNPRFRADVPHISGVTASEKIELRKIRHFEGKEAFS